MLDDVFVANLNTDFGKYFFNVKTDRLQKVQELLASQGLDVIYGYTPIFQQLAENLAQIGPLDSDSFAFDLSSIGLRQLPIDSLESCELCNEFAKASLRLTDQLSKVLGDKNG